MSVFRCRCACGGFAVLSADAVHLLLESSVGGREKEMVPSPPGSHFLVYRLLVIQLGRVAPPYLLFSPQVSFPPLYAVKTNVKTTSFSPDRTLTVMCSGILTVDAVMRGKCLMKALEKTNRPGEERLPKLSLLKKKKKKSLVNNHRTGLLENYYKLILEP